MTTIEVAEDFAQDAHLFAGLLRADGPARRVRMPRGLDCYIITDFAQARALLADSRLHKDNRRAYELFESKLPAGATNQGGFGEALGRHMLNTDPPDHSRLRKLVNKAFTGRTVARLRPRIEEITAELLDALAGQERADLLPSFAAPLPITVICELLGVAPEDRTEFSAWSKTLLSSSTPEDAQHAAQSMLTYLTALVTQKRAEPAEDLLSDLVHASDDGDSLSQDELISMAFLLLVAGHETTVNLIANAVLAMLRDPAQWRALGAEPSRVAAVVEETMRYDPPVQLVMRIAGEDMTIGEVDVPKGDSMLLLTAASHRDPDAIERPNEFDPDRETIRHLGFGKGPHFCIGAPLARLEASVALSAVTARFPDAHIAGEPVYKPNVTLRGLASLPIAL
jgi:cytochrome P450